MIEVIGLILIAMLAENMVLVKCLGLGWPKDTIMTEAGAWRMGVSLVLVMVVTTLVSWVVNRCILEFFGVTYFRLLVYTLLTYGVVRLLEVGLRVFFPVLHRHLRRYLSETIYNCAVLGVALLITTRSYTLPQALLYSLASGVGILLVLVIFTGMQEQASFQNCPKFFRGYPIGLLTAGLMAMALMGFYGLNIT